MHCFRDIQTFENSTQNGFCVAYHLQAVQKWLQHRAACQRNTTAMLPASRTYVDTYASTCILTRCLRRSLTESASTSALPPTEQQLALASRSGPPSYRATHHSTSPISPKPGPGVSQNNHHTRHHSTDPSFHDLNPSLHPCMVLKIIGTEVIMSHRYPLFQMRSIQ